MSDSHWLYTEAETTDDAPLTILTFFLLFNTIATCEIFATMVDQNGDGMSIKARWTLQRKAGVVTLIGETKDTHSGKTWIITPQITGDLVELMGIGEAGLTIRWKIYYNTNGN